MSLKILIIEDEPDIRKNLEYNLSREGYSVLTAASIAEAEQLIYSNNLSLVLLDLMLPDGSGLELCKKMKSDPDVQNLPIIILTAKDDEVDKVVGFEIGADDYVTKPFSPKELIARIKALLRRTSAPEDDSLVFAGIRLELASHKAFVNEDRVSMGPTEFKLLVFFMRNPDRVFDRSQLVDEVWGRSVVVEERTVDVHILRLRKVLKPWGRDHVIETVRGVGYRLAS